MFTRSYATATSWVMRFLGCFLSKYMEKKLMQPKESRLLKKVLTMITIIRTCLQAYVFLNLSCNGIIHFIVSPYYVPLVSFFYASFGPSFYLPIPYCSRLGLLVDFYKSCLTSMSLLKGLWSGQYWWFYFHFSPKTYFP